MSRYSLAHLSDASLLRDLASLVSRDRATTADLLAHIAEVDTRRLYAPAGYPSMRDYCIGALRMSEDAASRRIQAARAARRFPALFSAVADGRLHLTGVCLLAPHLTDGNEAELVTAASNQSKAEIELLLARRGCAKREVSGAVRLIPEECATPHALAHVDRADSTQARFDEVEWQPSNRQGSTDQQETERPRTEDPECEPADPRLAQPSTPERYSVRLTIDRATFERLRYAQALLSHAVPYGNVAQVFDRALVALITQLEKRKFGAGARCRHSHSRYGSKPSTHIPASMRRAVWERDKGQCTFVGTDGHRCGSTKLLEFDHVNPRVRDPEASVAGLRLRCRAHNQLEAERIFGTEFMARKREESRRAFEKTKRTVEEGCFLPTPDSSTREAAAAEAKEQILDVMAALRGLGIKGDQARRAADHAASLENATLVERIRAALQFHGEWISRSPRAARIMRTSG